MTEPNPASTPPLATAAETDKEIRRLLHDLNNAMEIILQSSYLVSTLELGENGQQWIKLLEQGVQQAAGLNRELREVIRKSHAL